MRTAKRFVITSAFALLGLSASLAHAQEIQVKGPLAGAPAVIGMRVYREMRFQIQLHSTLTLQDEYSRTILGGGQLMFHPTDWLGVGVWGGFALAHLDTYLTDQITAKGQTNSVNVLSLPNARGFPNQIAHINWMAAPQVAFIPLRGKLGIFEKLFVDTDFYLVGGIAFAGIEERGDVSFATYSNCHSMPALADQIRCLQPTAGTGHRASRSTIAPTFGVGLSLYLAEFLALTIEWRAMPFAWNTSGTDESGDPRGDFPDGRIDNKDRLSHFNHMLTLGLAFYLPTEPGHSHTEEVREMTASPKAAASGSARTRRKASSSSSSSSGDDK